MNYLQNSQNFNYYHTTAQQQHLINQHYQFYQGQQQQPMGGQQNDNNSFYFAHNRQAPCDNFNQHVQQEDQQSVQQKFYEIYNKYYGGNVVYGQNEHYNQASLEYSQYSSGSSNCQQNDSTLVNNDMARHNGEETVSQ